jgi:hypothetical protein
MRENAKSDRRLELLEQYYAARDAGDQEAAERYAFLYRRAYREHWHKERAAALSGGLGDEP